MNNKFKMLLTMMLMFVGISAMAAANSPMEIITQVGITQAQDNFIPAAIVWILLLTGAMSAIMQKVMPFVVGAVCCIVMALAPDLATSFGNFDFLTGAGVSAS